MSETLSIISWNVNGIRALERKGQFDWLVKQSPDIFCLQETKARPDQLSEDLGKPSGYEAYFSYPTEKKGYSGVALYTKKKPINLKEGLGQKDMDQEGRLLIAEYETFYLLNCYFPNGGGGPERLQYKLDFYDEFLAYIDDLKKTGKIIIFCGDVNTAHEEIDLARPKENEQNTGFLPEERAWIDELERHGFIDIWRHQNPQKKDSYTYWDMKTRARERNVGWRIDYFFATQNILPKLENVAIHEDVLGSDHCPISLTFKC